LLEHCPFCDYALEGLPEKHVCPECGQPFDRRWVVFGGKSAWRTAKQEWRILGGIVWGVMLLGWAYVLWGASGVHAVFVWGCWVALLSQGVLFVNYRPKRFVAVGPAGIALGDRRTRELREVEWPNVWRVYVDPRGRLHIHLKDLRDITWSLGLGLDAEAHRCEEYVDKHFELPE
jgi:hypothetical protein